MNRNHRFPAQNSTPAEPRAWILLNVGERHPALVATQERFLGKFRELLKERTTDPGIADEPARHLEASDIAHAMDILNNSVSGPAKVDATVLIAVCADDLHKDALTKIAGKHKETITFLVLRASHVVTMSRAAFERDPEAFPRKKMDETVTHFRNALRIRSGPTASASRDASVNANVPEKPKYGIGIADVVRICGLLDEGKLLPGSSDLFTEVNKPSLIARLDDLWPQAEHQEKLLRILVVAISKSRSDLSIVTSQFLMKVLESKLFEKIIEQHVNPISYDALKRRSPSTDIVAHFMELLHLGITRLPTASERHLPKFGVLNMSLTHPDHQSESFPSEAMKDILAKLKAAVESYIKEKEARMQVPESAPQGRRQFAGSEGPPPEDYREVPIVPTLNDIIDSRDVFLRAAKEVGRYDNDEHYLDVQFRLLREDLLRPIRQGITDYIEGGLKKTDLFVYRDVAVTKAAMSKQAGDLLNVVRVKVHKRMRWNKRLIYGSLVCLSSDGFRDNLVFGVVKDRDENKLVRGIVGLKIENPNALDYNARYLMVESPAFFEAYRHVLKALQDMPNGEPVPFSKYLVAVETDVDLPQYLRNDVLHVDFKSIRKETSVDEPPADEAAVAVADKKRRQQEPLLVDPRSMDLSLLPAILGMDQSQFDAMKYALCSELTVIQGPPGTGKTWMGLQLTRLLLDNERLWNPADDQRPILVVCYTNHALDQFLEGIRGFCPNDIVRVGGRCKIEKLQEYTLAVKRRTRPINDVNVRRRFFHVRSDVQALAQFLSETATHLRELDSELAHPKAIVAGMWREQDHRDDSSDEDLYLSDDYYGSDSEEEMRIFRERIRRRYERANREGRKLRPRGVVESWRVVDEEKFLEDLDKERHMTSRELDRHLQELRRAKNYLRQEFLVQDEYIYDAVGRKPEDLLEWLAGADRPCPMDVTKVQILMRSGLHEIPAKMATVAFHGFEADAIAAIWNQHSRRIRADADWAKLDTVVESWPTMVDVNLLVREGLEPAIATQLLHSSYRSAAELCDEYRRSRMQNVPAAQLQVDAQPDPEPMAVVEELPDPEELQLVREENEQREAVAQEEQDDIIEIGWDWQSVDGKKQLSRMRHAAVLQYVNATEPFPEDIAMSASSCRSIIDRWRLYRKWVMEAKADLKHRMEIAQPQYTRYAKELSQLRSMGDTSIMKSAKIVGMTTTGAAMHQAGLLALKPRIVIVEEAAEVLEAHLLTSLTVACEHAILIGDHKQLRPSPAVYELAKKYNFDVSLFERLIKNQFPYRMLKKQHRMRPEISRSLMPFFYEDLADDDSVHGRDDVLGMQKNMAFINHSAPEVADAESKSHSNPLEAEFAIRTAIYLVQQGYAPDDVTILCTYLEQLLNLRRRAKDFPILKGVRIENVDNYQGEESKIIILSLVRSTSPKDSIGFLSVPNRVCVALSRARDGFYVFGNIDFLASKSKLWDQIRHKLKEVGALCTSVPVRCRNHGTEQDIASPEDFPRLCPEGGCQTPCNMRLNCGHSCEKPCHALDAQHEKVVCTKPCGRTCPSTYAHPCKLLCYLICSPCAELVEKHLPCGHVKADLCHLLPEETLCAEPCEKVLSCQHKCRGRCNRPCSDLPCEEPVDRALECGHVVQMKCHEDPKQFKCTALVSKPGRDVVTRWRHLAPKT